MSLNTHPNFWLKPLTFLYGAGVKMRNAFFDHGLFKQETFNIPVICVGNITVGGTGKTPHVEYLIELLRDHYRIAVLSRGYKRKTKGLIEACTESTVGEVGDEPKQIKLKYPDVRVIVDGNRRRALKWLLEQPVEKRPQIVILDDGYQHRYIKPSYAILLTDYNRPMIEDSLLPEGRLREPMNGRFRADCVIITKCPETMQPIDRRIADRDLGLYPHQKAFFSAMVYGKPRSIISGKETDLPSDTPLLVISGIAKPEPLHLYLSNNYVIAEKLVFDDHHNFSIQEIDDIDKKFRQQLNSNPNAAVVTTEKDAMRLAEFADYLSEEIKERLFYIPIKVKIMFGMESSFNKLIHQAASRTNFSI